MKRIAVTIIISITFSLISCSDNNKKEDTKNKVGSIDEAIELTKSIWESERNVYALKDAIKPRSILTLDRYTEETFTTPGEECWIVFIYRDNINVMSIYEWIIVNRKTGRIMQVEATDPPAADSNLTYEEQRKTWITVKETRFGTVSQFSSSKINLTHRARPSSVVQRQGQHESSTWAIIVSGGVDPENNHMRYWNDCAWIYTVLRKIYDIPKDNILVLISDGDNPAADRNIGGNYDSTPTDLDGDGNQDYTLSNC